MKNKAPKSYLVIPITLSKFVAESRFYAPFKVYLYLKAHTSGKVKLNRKDLFVIAEALGYKSDKTIKNNIKKLIKKDWIGYNPASGYYFIRSIERVKEIENLHGYLSTVLWYSKIKYIKSFVAASIVKNTFQGKRKHLAKAALNDELSAKQLFTECFSNGFFPVSDSFLAKALKTTKSNAHKIKAKARKEDMIMTMPFKSVISMDANMATSVKKVYPEVSHRIVVKDKKVCLIEPDLVKPLVSLRRRNRQASF